jgi:hypothetical protein
MRGGPRAGAGRPRGSKDRPREEREADQRWIKADSLSGGRKESKAEIKQKSVIRDSNSGDERQAETFDGATGELSPLLRNPRLATLKDVRLEMAYVYKRMENRVIETADGSKLIFALGKIGDIISVAEFEERIEQLENQREQIMQDRQMALPATYGS